MHRLGHILASFLFLILIAENPLVLMDHWFAAWWVLATIAVLSDGLATERIALASAFCSIATLLAEPVGIGAFGGLCVFAMLRMKRQAQYLFLPCTGVICAVLALHHYGVYLHALAVSSLAKLHAVPQLTPIVTPVIALPCVYIAVAVMLYRGPAVEKREAKLQTLLVTVGFGMLLAVVAKQNFYLVSSVASPALLLLVWQIQKRNAINCGKPFSSYS